MANTYYLLDMRHTFTNYIQTKATAPQKLSVTRDLEFHVQFLFTFTIHSTNQDIFNWYHYKAKSRTNIVIFIHLLAGDCSNRKTKTVSVT